jgi:hypothetical protein
MMIYTFTIDYVLSTCPKVLTHVIPAMERTQRLLGTLEVIYDINGYTYYTKGVLPKIAALYRGF